MNTTHQQFQEVFNELSKFATFDKIAFLEGLLFQLTIAGRGIWSDNLPSDTEKAEAFKWLNELSHRIWNIHSALRQGKDDDSIIRLYENMKFYGDQSNLLKSHWVSTTVSAFENCKKG